MRSLQPRKALLPLAVVMATAAITFPLGVLAAHQFGDVPDSNMFHADIDAIADAGVTFGCGGGNYCPSEYVTREQMAAFMNRLGALAPGKTPVVNADRLDGLSSEDFLLEGGQAADADQLDGLDSTDFMQLVESGTTPIDLGSVGPLACLTSQLGTAATHGTQVLVSNPYDAIGATQYQVSGYRIVDGAGDQVWVKVCNLGLIADPAIANFDWSLVR